MSPRFTVVVPIRNEGDRALACLESLLAQDFPSERFEIVVVDGHSTDGSPERILARAAGERVRVRVVPDGRRSVAEARNCGILAARGDVVAFLDGDCEADRRWLAELDGVFADRAVAGAGGTVRLPAQSLFGRLEDADSLAHYRGFITSNVAYRRDVLLALGGFDPGLRCGEDWEIWWRVRDEGLRVEFVPSAVVSHFPAEIENGRDYLRKNLWYARQDVRAYRARAARVRARLREGLPVVWREPAHIAGPALLHAAGAAAVLALPVSRGLALAGAAALVGWAARHGVGAVPARELPTFVTVTAAKYFVRGVGTLLAIKDAAADALRGRAGAPSLAPPAPEPRARPVRRRPAFPAGVRGSP